MATRRVLVTGADGQLGREMRRASTSDDNYYLFTDIEELDITDVDDISKIVKQNSIDIIVNCAAYTNVDRAEDEPELADLLNNRAVGNLAQVAEESNTTLIHISTDYVFDGEAFLPYSEEHPVNPLGVYGATKLAGERSIEASGCRYITIRTSWLYSQWGVNFVKTMRRLTSERDTLSVVFDQVGTPTYAADLADLIVHIIATDQLDKVGIYHYSNEGVCSWYDFAQAISLKSGNSCDITPIHSHDYPTKAQRPHYSLLDKSKVKSTFAVRIPHWQSSLDRCIATLREEQLKAEGNEF